LSLQRNDDERLSKFEAGKHFLARNKLYLFPVGVSCQGTRPSLVNFVVRNEMWFARWLDV